MASAITSKGISTAGTATFATIAANVKKIVTGINPVDLGSVHICPNNAYSGNTKTGNIYTGSAWPSGFLLIEPTVDGNGGMGRNTYSISGASVIATIHSGYPSYSREQSTVLLLKNIAAGT